MIKPLGNVQIIPAPIVAGHVTLLEKLVGAVGPVPHATQQVVSPAGSPTSSGKNACGEVGVPPIAAGLPRPYVPATAVTCENPNSSMVDLVDAVVRISHVAAAAEVTIVLCDIE